MKNRGGYMLVELAAAIAAGSALTAVAVGVIYLLTESERASRDQFRQAMAAARLSEEFRSDVRAATALDLPAKDNAAGQVDGGRAGADWRFRFPAGRVVEYRVADGEFRRVEYDGERLLRRESFRLSGGTKASIEESHVEGGTLVRLRIDPPADASREPDLRPFQIDAILAADRRFLPSGGP